MYWEGIEREKRVGARKGKKIQGDICRPLKKKL